MIKEPNVDQNADDNIDGDDPVVPPRVILGPHNQEKAEHHEENGDSLRHPDYRRFNSLWEGTKSYLIKLREAGPDRHIELLLAFAIVFFAGRQYSIMKSSSESSTGQLNQIITTANQIDKAAGSFSKSADQINTGITNAVTQLGMQAGAANTQAGASKTLAGISTEQWTANRELIESQRASISVSLGRVINPITFHDGHPSIVFSILIQDTGAIKATHVTVRFKPYFSLMGNNIFTEPLQKQRDYCAVDTPPTQEWSWDEKGKRIDLKGLRDWTVTIEPHSTFEQQLNFGMGKPTEAEIIKWPPSDIVKTNPALPVTDRVFPMVVGCIDYQSGAMPEKHQTGFIFEIQEAFSDGSAAPTLVHYPIDLPRERVVVTQFFFGQGKQY